MTSYGLLSETGPCCVQGSAEEIQWIGSRSAAKTYSAVTEKGQRHVPAPASADRTAVS